MKLEYYSDIDSLYIDLSSNKATDSKEIADGLVIDFDSKGNVVGIDIQYASKKLDLKSLETVSLPFQQTKSF